LTPRLFELKKIGFISYWVDVFPSIQEVGMKMASELSALCARLVGVCIVFFIASKASASTTITSFPTSSSGGISNIVDSGQVFLVPTDGDSYFANFSCEMGGVGVPIQFVAVLYPFDQGKLKVTGPAVYTTQTTVPSLFPYTLMSFTPSTPISLTPGGAYLFTFQQGGFGNSTNLQFEYGDNYANGQYVTTQGTAPYLNASWSKVSYDTNLDIGFSATFVVPEPSSAANRRGHFQ
jgi:hypothetical protein